MRALLKILALSIVASASLKADQKISVLIVDGRNNHNWQITTDALRATLEATGRFTVSTTTAPPFDHPPRTESSEIRSPAGAGSI